MKPNTQTPALQAAWNKGKLIGQKSPLKLKEIWAIRIRLQLSEKMRDLALFKAMSPLTVGISRVQHLADLPLNQYA